MITVEDSVYQCNVLYGHQVKSLGRICPNCKNDSWKTFWGIDLRFKSEYNPGEYCEFTCSECGYSDGPEQS